MKYYRVLSIAGSDSGGGAGIQADIKSISANGGYAMTAITAITSQNTLGVQAVFPLPVETIESQILSVINDIGVDAVKIGMLHSPEIIQCVSKILSEHQVPNIVLDPVMVASSGDSLFQHDAIDTLKTSLFPISKIITPNIPEAEKLCNGTIRDKLDMMEAAWQLSNDGSISVLLKGGHMTGEEMLCDVLCDAEIKGFKEFNTSKIETQNTHGTGCTLSSAIATYLAQGYRVVDAVSAAKHYITEAIQSGANYTLGAGHGPVNHFHNLEKK